MFCAQLRRQLDFLLNGSALALVCGVAFASPRIHAQSGMSALERELLLGEANPSSGEITENPARQDEAAPEVAPAPEVDKEQLEEIEQAITGPERIPFEQVLVVQRRYILKEDRQEITPFYFGIQPANSFRREFQWGFSWAYHLTESFGIEGIHAAFLTNYGTGLDKTIKDKTGLLTDPGATPMVVLGSTLIWTPFKSKAATRANVYHFETYFNLGAGMSLGETATNTVGIYGLGFRAFLNRRSLMKIELRDYMSFGGSSSHRLSFIVGGGFLL